MSDFTSAVRSLRRRPTATLAILATLGLAIGANVAVFSVIDGMLFRPLPFPDADRLVAIDAEIGGTFGKMTAREVRAIEQDSKAISEVAAFYPSQYKMTGHGLLESVATTIDTSGLFRVLGVRPVAGEVWPTTFDWTTQSTVMLAHGLSAAAFRRRFAHRRQDGQARCGGLHGGGRAPASLRLPGRRRALSRGLWLRRRPTRAVSP